MSQDKMQDVFPIDFNFVNGEQPDSDKLTGLVKQSNNAFDRVVSAIGDPWEYNVHSVGGSSYLLSPSRLAQTNIARMIGPSDYVSPKGACLNEGITTDVRVTLARDRTSWRIGFPLKKKISSDIGPNNSSAYSGYLQDLSFGSDITLYNGPTGSFLSANLKLTLEDVVDSGDWHIDYDKGIITTYDPLSANAVLNITTMNMFGPGLPWGTANIIPSWDQTTNYCSVTGGPTTWTLSLPSVTNGPRSSGITYGPNSTWNVAVPGENASHRLPYSITSVLNTGDAIPDGFMQLWEENTNRVIPLTTFYYKDEYSVTITTPENILSITKNYRLIVTGSSLAENISWLMSVVRDTSHEGMSNCQDGRTIAFTNPISHDDLSDLYNGDLPATTVDVDKYKFTKSNYPTNPHPQYLHRGGYMGNDSGNSANAMRGNIVFTEKDTYELNNHDSDSYGIKWCGNNTSYSELSFFGGENSSTPVPFGINGVGIRKDSSADRYGAVSFTTSDDRPFYLRCDYASTDYNSGTSIGFDYNNNNEMNYIKLVDGGRNGNDDVPHLPVRSSSSVSWSSSLPTSPTLSRMSFEGFREWRFRSVAKVSNASNTGLGGNFDEFFTGPGIIGVDYLNLYSNAIFFSEQGDGVKTSLADRSSWFHDNNDSRPTGIYYEPGTFGGQGSINFYMPDNAGDNQKSTFSSTRYSSNIGSYNSSGSLTASLYLSAGSTNVNIQGYSGDIIANTEEDMFITAGNNIHIGADSTTDVSVSTYLSEDAIVINAGGTINSTASQGDRSIVLKSGGSWNNGWNDDSVVIMSGTRDSGFTPVGISGSNPYTSIEAQSSIALNVSDAYNSTFDGILAKVGKSGMTYTSGFDITPTKSMLWNNDGSGKDKYVSVNIASIKMFSTSADIVLETDVSGDILLDPASQDVILGLGGPVNLKCDGSVSLWGDYDGTSGSLSITSSELALEHSTGNIVMNSLPSSDPHVAGALYTYDDSVRVFLCVSEG